MNEFDTAVDNHDNAATLRVLLHSIKGISAVSSAPAFVPVDEEE